MALQVLKGKIVGYKCKRGAASFVFTDDDCNAMGVIAIAAGLVGLSGQAVGTAISATTTEEDADYLEFDLDGQHVKGWVWRSPFKEGDNVEVAAEWRGSHYELCAIARPDDRIVALYPHCSRASRPHWRNAWSWWFLGTSIALLIGGGIMESYGRAVYAWSPFFDEKTGSLVVGGFVCFCYPFFALMTWSLGRKWMPFARLSEKVFRAFGWERPLGIDLVKRSKQGKKGDEPAEYGVFYFRY